MRSVSWCLIGAFGFVLPACSGASVTALETEGGKNPPSDQQDGGGTALDGAVTDSAGQDGGACVVRQLAADPIPAELILLADHSGSMIDTISGNTTKWTEESGGIKAFVAESGSARQYGALIVHPAINTTDICAPSAYAPPVVGVATFSANQSKIVTALGSMMPNDSSPWSAVITSGLVFAKAEQLAHPERRVATVFMADDSPTWCNTDIQNQIVPVVQSYAEPMFVIGLSWYMTDQTGFDALAKAGKTESSTFLYGTAITTTAVKGQLDKIRDQTGCDVSIPSEMGGTIDPSKYDFEIEYQGTRLKTASVANAGECTSGMQYWARDAKHAALCPQTCKTLDDAQTKLRFLSRCP